MPRQKWTVQPSSHATIVLPSSELFGFDFIGLLHVYPTMAEALKIVAISRYKDPARSVMPLFVMNLPPINLVNDEKLDTVVALFLCSWQMRPMAAR
jgi:hypothetical protein